MSKLSPLLIILLHVLLLVSWQFSDWPEMYSYPYLINNGYKLYQDIINPYTPLLPLALAAYYKIFTLSLASLKVATGITIISIDLLLILYLKSTKSKPIIIFLLVYILWQVMLEGNGLWFDLALTPLILASFFLMSRNKLHFVNGILLGTAFLIKQTAAIYILVCLMFILFKFKSSLTKIKITGIFILGTTLPLIPTAAYLFKNQILKDFIYWALLYPFGHLKSTGFALAPTPKQILVTVLFFLPLILVIRYAKERTVPLLLAYSFASVFFSLPRFSYFHLQPLIPFLALTLAFIYPKLNMTKLGNITIKAYLLLVLGLFAYFLTRYFGQEPRFYNSKVQQNIALLTRRLDTNLPVFFYNTSSEYIVFANILPPKPWAETFPWYLEVPHLQEKITKSLSDNSINQVIFQSFASEGTYTPGSYIPQTIDKYIKFNFKTYTQINNNLWILEE